jgi:osomolarity two-component system sensor histidine kinase NIK1
MDFSRQTETIREYEHLRYIPIVLLAPVRPFCVTVSKPPSDSCFSVIVEPAPFELYVTMLIDSGWLTDLFYSRCHTVVKWCLDNSISSEVTTPVSVQDLASALISALESSTVSPAAATNDVVFDILLAEDNLVNQKLAVKILEKYGHTVEIAENGSLAVDAFRARVQRNRPFDIILVRVRSCLSSLC